MSGPLAGLEGTRIQRVDVPEPDLLALGLHGPDVRATLLLSTSPRAAGVGCVHERPRGLVTEGIAKLLRNLLEGTRIERTLDAGGGALAIDLRLGPETLALIHEGATKSPNLLVLDGLGRVVAALHPDRLAPRGLQLGEPWEPPPSDLLRDVPGDLPALLEAGRALLETRQSQRNAERRVALLRGIRRARERMARRAAATLGDLDRAAEAPRMRQDAGALLANLHVLARHCVVADLLDWSTDPPTARTVEIDPERGPKGTAEALFTRARKLEAGASIAAARHAEAHAVVARLDALHERLMTSDDTALEALEGEAVQLGAGPKARARVARRSRNEPSRSPFRQYVGHGGRPIRVGKTARDNDELTFRHATPHDLWLHVRGASGSHVVVPLGRNEACPPELLIDAAHLAAHFSHARGEALVEVETARRKQLRKPRGGAPGQVLVAQGKTLALRVENARLARLLAAAHAAGD